MNKRYFFWFTASFLTGVGLSAKNILFCGLSLAFFVALAACLRKKGHGKLFVSMAVGMVIGTLCFSWHNGMYAKKADILRDKTVTACGRVEEVTKGEKLRLLIRGEIEADGQTVKNTAAYVYPREDRDFAYGDMVTVSGKAYVGKAPKNFGERDFRLYAMGKGISASLYPSAEEIEITGSDFSFFRPKDAAFFLRQKAQEALSGRVSTDTEGFLRAYLTGDESLLSAESDETLNAAGLSHVVAVSGMHLNIMVGACMMLFGILKIKKRLFSVFFYILFTWFAVLFTGAGTSVLRAALMLTVFFFADFVRRDNDSLTSLAFAAFSLCFVNPGTLFDVGFQLSCASTLTILLFGDSFRNLLRKLPRFLRDEISIFWAASIGFTPVMAVQFGSFCVVGVLANLLVSPLLSPILIAGFLGIFFSGVPGVSHIIFFLLDKSVGYVLGVAKWCASLPFANVFLQNPGILSCGGYILFVAAFYLRLQKKTKYLAVICILALIPCILEAAGTLAKKEITTVTFLSVGSGDCAMISGKDGVFLIDSGGSDVTDVAENTIIPYLSRQGIRKINGAFLTSYRLEHGGAMVGLMEKGMIETLYLPYHKDDNLKRLIAETAMGTGTKVRFLGDGDVIMAGGIRIESFDSAAGSKENNGMLYRVQTEGVKLLFTGKTDEKGQRRLLYRGADVDCDILKVARYGNAGDFFGEFTDAASPSLAVISCSGNTLDLPHENVLAEYEKRNIPLYRTDENGTIKLYLRHGKWQIQTLY
ncbi:MAG: ComEC/Rec2 family competence protein [Clostridia bacterium]|nr:ComEC/Rec2 family competence protein [Clostridia bacterium]